MPHRIPLVSVVGVSSGPTSPRCELVTRWSLRVAVAGHQVASGSTGLRQAARLLHWLLYSTHSLQSPTKLSGMHAGHPVLMG